MITRPQLQDSKMPLPFEREYATQNRKSHPVALNDNVADKSILKWCECNHVDQISTLYKHNNIYYGNYIVTFTDKLYDDKIASLIRFYSLLVDNYAVEKNQIELFSDKNKNIFLQVNIEAFSYGNGHPRLKDIYKNDR